jgi:hypothetical protein
VVSTGHLYDEWIYLEAADCSLVWNEKAIIRVVLKTTSIRELFNDAWYEPGSIKATFPLVLASCFVLPVCSCFFLFKIVICK